MAEGAAVHVLDAAVDQLERHASLDELREHLRRGDVLVTERQGDEPALVPLAKPGAGVLRRALLHQGADEAPGRRVLRVREHVEHGSLLHDPAGSITATRWARVRTTSISWVISTIVTPSSSLTRRSSASTSAVVCGSSALVGSSASRILGLVASARAMPTRCFWPPESCVG